MNNNYLKNVIRKIFRYLTKEKKNKYFYNFNIEEAYVKDSNFNIYGYMVTNNNDRNLALRLLGKSCREQKVYFDVYAVDSKDLSYIYQNRVVNFRMKVPLDDIGITVPYDLLYEVNEKIRLRNYKVYIPNRMLIRLEKEIGCNSLFNLKEENLKKFKRNRINFYINNISSKDIELL